MPSQRRTLFFEDVSFSCSQRDLHDLFAKYGELYEIRFKGPDEIEEGEMPYGFVRYIHAQSAVAAKNELNNTIIFGHKIKFV